MINLVAMCMAVVGILVAGAGCVYNVVGALRQENRRLGLSGMCWGFAALLAALALGNTGFFVLNLWLWLAK